MKQIILVLSALILLINISMAQNEAVNWLFGDHAKITFTGPDYAPVSQKGSAMLSDEGSAVISDSDGNLMFYTNGETVWNRNNEIMPLGSGLKGDNSATQSAIIVPLPGNRNIYYIFTLDAQAKFNGFRCHVVDMTLDNGLGDLTGKNGMIYAPSTEKLTAVANKKKTGYWIITHSWGDNKFLCYQLTKDGLDKTPVESAVGSVHGGDEMNAIGYMKFSPNGKKLALAIYISNTVEIFDFDNETGIVSNPITLQSNDLLTQVYGLEFSPDGRKLYTSTKVGPSMIVQFNLDYKSAQQILDNAYMVAYNSASLGYYALQIAPDKKIYVAKRDKVTLDVIEEPNKSGQACSFKPNGFILDYGECRGGLPVFIQSYFNEEVRISANNPLCEGQQLVINATKIQDATYSWTGPNGFSSDQPGIKIDNAGQSEEGNYFLTVIHPDGNIDTVSIYIDVLSVQTNKPGDLAFGVVCPGEASVKNLTISNQGHDPFIIDSAYIQKYKNVFTIITPKAFQATILPGESLDLSIKYLPSKPGIFPDSLIVVINEPCYRRLASSISGSSITSIVVSIPDTTGNVGDDNYVYPVRARFACGNDKLTNVKYKIDMEYDASAFLPDANSSTITDNYVINGTRHLTLEGVTDISRDFESQIAEIRGRVLLADKDSIPIYLTNVSFSDTLISISKKDGSLEITGLCRRSLSRVRTFEPIQMLVTPLPANETATLLFTGSDNGMVDIDIYNMQGNKLVSTAHNKTSRESEATVKIRELPAGLYQVVARQGENVCHARLVVGR